MSAGKSLPLSVARQAIWPVNTGFSLSHNAARIVRVDAVGADHHVAFDLLGRFPG